MSPVNAHRKPGRGRWAALVLVLIVSGLGGFLALSPGPVHTVAVGRNDSGGSWQVGARILRDRNFILRRLLGSERRWEQCTLREAEAYFEQVASVSFGSGHGEDFTSQEIILTLVETSEEVPMTAEKVRQFVRIYTDPR